jgi:hypothetical protein
MHVKSVLFTVYMWLPFLTQLAIGLEKEHHIQYYIFTCYLLIESSLRGNFTTISAQHLLHIQKGLL